MGKHKNLNDVIHGDRAVSGGGAVKSHLDEWDEWEKQNRKGGDVVSTSSYASSKSKDHVHYSGGGERCFQKHPALKLPGTDLLIHGGSCSAPVVKDADVYIGFDHSMRWTERHYPWKKGAEVFFQIPDMGVPAKPEEFRKLVLWTRKQLEEGKKVHCGCIGGHGRTGTFLSALVCEFGEKDAIRYVREHYCKKAVESTSQVKFLTEEFGITKVEGYKSSWSSSSSKSSKGSSSSGSRVEKYGPLKGNGCIWDAPAIADG